MGQAWTANLEMDRAAGMGMAGDAGQGCPWHMALLPVPCLAAELRGLKSFQALHLHLTAPDTASSSSVLKYPSCDLAQA